MNLAKNTLSEQIYQILRNDILTQAIPLGEKLTLKALQERFGVSSTPIRDAFTRLSEDGLVNYYSNVGVTVIELTQKDLTELYQFMGDLDSLAIRYCASYARQEQVLASLKNVLDKADALEQEILACGALALRKSSDAAEYNAQSEKIHRWINYSDQFHLVFYDYCQNGRLTRAAEKQRSQLTIFSNMYEALPETQLLIAKWHVSIYESYLAGRVEEAALKMKEHLDQSLSFALCQI